jgi:cobalamin biosynthesis protein CobT
MEFNQPGDMPPWGKGPVQGKIHNKPDYIKNEFPLIDKFETCTVIIHKPGGASSPEDPDAVEGDGSGEEEEEEEEEEEGGGGGEEEEEEEEVTDTTEEQVEEEEDKEDAEEENEEEEVGRGELHNRREFRELKEAHDRARIQQRELTAAEKELSPFADVVHIAAVVAGVVVMVLGVAALARRSRKKKHKL